MDRMKDTVRMRDRRLQGSENPSLAQFDKRSPETVMYSGRLVEDSWSCPLRIHQTSTAGDQQTPDSTEGA
jgi:FPC/CPF motif-containing protein YcgG